MNTEENKVGQATGYFKERQRLAEIEELINNFWMECNDFRIYHENLFSMAVGSDTFGECSSRERVNYMYMYKRVPHFVEKLMEFRTSPEREPMTKLVEIN